MFTGIVAAVGRIESVKPLGTDGDAGVRLNVEAGGLDLEDVQLGDSITIQGACMTVVAKTAHSFEVDVSRESLNCTAGLGEPGEVNLEKALRAHDRLGGHIVSGHVDGIGEVVSVEAEGGSHRVRIRAPSPLHRFIAPKGSITVEGVSLTVNEVEDDVFGVNLIPHTWDVTTLGELKPGSRVNLEIDMLARYLARWRETA
jgi:riboflavin synthase